MKPQKTTKAKRPASPWFIVAVFGAMNLGLLAAAGQQLTGGQQARLDSAHAQVQTAEAQRFASEIDGRAAKMATAIIPYVANAPMVAQQAAKLAPEGARYVLAGEIEGQWKVLASSDKALAQKAPQANLEAALGAPTVSGYDGDAGKGPGARYSTLYMVPVMPAPKAAAATPRPQPSPQWVKRRVVVNKPEPARSYTIKAGDTLYQISRDHFGSTSMFLDIYQANKATIGEDRAKLPVGSTIQIPAGHRQVVEEKLVLETPAPVDEPAKPQTAHVRRLALSLTVPVPAGSQAPAVALPARFSVNHEAWLTAAVAGGTAGLWLLAGLWLGLRQRRLLAAQRLALVGAVSERLVPRGPNPDLAAMRSAWQVELVATTLKGPEPPSSFVALHAFNESQLGLFIGEASGVHPNAAVSRGLAEAFWRARATTAEAPGLTLTAINSLLLDYVPQGDHVTAFYAQVDVMSGAVRFAGAAHGGAYVLKPDGEMALLGGRGLPLGVSRELFAGRLEEGVTRLVEGERLFFFTDALIKAEGPDGEPFGLSRLEACLREGASGNCDRLVAQVRQAVSAFVGKRGLPDDAAVACLRLAPQGVSRVVAQAPAATTPADPG